LGPKESKTCTEKYINTAENCNNAPDFYFEVSLGYKAAKMAEIIKSSSSDALTCRVSS
jgi:hypothetical protein